MGYYYYTRQDVNERLRLAKRQSFRIVAATPSGRLRSDTILLLLNGARVGIPEALDAVPCDILTPDEAVKRFGVTRRELRRWSRRTKNPVPHFRINSHTLRYPAAKCEIWLAENSYA